MTLRDVHWHSATLLKWTQGENGRSYSGVFSLWCFERDRTKEKKNWKFLSYFSLRVSPEQPLSIQGFSNIHGVYVGLPLNSLMAFKELLQHSIWPFVYKCVWSSSEEGNDFVYIWGKEHRQQKKKSLTECWRHLYWSVSLDRQYFLLSSAQKEKWMGGKTRSRERTELQWSPVHLITGTTVAGPMVSECPVWQPHFLHSQTPILP